jgi:hypothetical protein
MRHFLFPLRACCILLATSACAVDPAMVKEDFRDRGLSIVLPDEPAYQAELQRLGFSAPPSPYSVVVKNTSHRGIVALGLRFTKQFANGHIATSDVAGTEPSALIDRGQPAHDEKPYRALVMPGGSRLVTPEDGIIIHPPSGPGPGHTVFRTRLPWVVTKVELDSVVFDDGEAIGPDHLDVVERLRAHVDAQQDLVEEISGRMANGEPVRGVLQDLAGSTPAGFSRETEGATASAIRGRVYASVRLRYIKELSTTEANAGEEAAIRRLRQVRYATRPQIRVQGGN